MRHTPVFKFLFCLLFFLNIYTCPFSGHPKLHGMQTKPDTTQRKVYLEYADEVAGGEKSYLQSGKLVSERIRSARGNVRFRDQTTTVTCDTATEYLDSRKIHLIGRVVITRDTVIIKGHEGFYYPDLQLSVLDSNVSLSDQKVLLNSSFGKYYSSEQRGVFSKDVELIDKETIIFCDSLIYFRRQDHSIAINNVRIINDADNTIITGGYGEHFNKLKHSFIEKQPVLKQIESSGENQTDTLVIKSRRMDAFRNPADSLQRIEITDSVRIWRGSLTAKAVEAVYLLNQKQIILTGDPLIWYENTQVSGDSIAIQLVESEGEKNRIDKIYIYNQAFLCSADSNSTQKFDQLSGTDMILTFDEASRLLRTDVYRQARSLYYLYDKETPSGANLSSGDEITISFLDNKVDRIKIKGGVEGKQFPEWMLRNQDLNLPHFKWRIDEKPIR